MMGATMARREEIRKAALEAKSLSEAMQLETLRIITEQNWPVVSYALLQSDETMDLMLDYLLELTE